MDKCCAVIASEDAGSTLELVKDGANGFTFKAGDVKTLSQRISVLVNDAGLRHHLGLSAWHTMQEWSPHVGAQKLLSIVNNIINGEKQVEDDGLLCGCRG
jgi:glycosyltransferase involved in cell wall biosynthesis